MSADHFAVCSMCRKPIAYGAKYIRCSVTACNAGRMKLVFCTPSCWDAHLPTARHRSASYIEETATREAQSK
jgi:LSD1 subclass zinc finger protein